MAVEITAGSYKCARHNFGVLVLGDWKPGKIDRATFDEAYKTTLSTQAICKDIEDGKACDAENCQIFKLREKLFQYMQENPKVKGD